MPLRILKSLLLDNTLKRIALLFRNLVTRYFAKVFSQVCLLGIHCLLVKRSHYTLRKEGRYVIWESSVIHANPRYPNSYIPLGPVLTS